MGDFHDMTSGWDPLEAVKGSGQEILTAAQKREIKNILKSYVGTYDPMSELIQNAMDAVERRKAIDAGDFSPRITIKINLRENSFQVVDNGIGFDKEEFISFLAPNISFKNSPNSRGNKGVGATYIAYGFNNLELRTKNEFFSFIGRFRKGRDWVEDNSGTVHRPQIEPIASSDALFDTVDQGTSFRIVFGGKHTRPTNLSWYQATTPDQWLYLLLVKTPLGHIDLPEGTQSAIRFDLIVIDAEGNERKSENCNAKYKYPHEEIKASQRLSTVRDAQKNAIDRARDPAKAIEKYKNSNGIFEFFSSKDLATQVRTLSEAEKGILSEYSVGAYGYFAYSTTIWDQLNDVKARLRKNYRVLRGGLQMANNHMAQGELITIPLTKSIGHQNQTHVIVHFNGADPDLGRKGFQPELRSLSEKIAVFIVGQLAARRDILKGDTGAAPDIEKEIKVHEWIRNQEAHEKEHPLILQNENFFLPTKKISVQSEPLSEQDVVVLFSQLLAGGVIRGIKLLATSQTSQYDGVFRYVAQKPFENLVFQKSTNPLGVYEEQLVSEYVGPPNIIEYKFSLDGLVREFESEVKNERDVQLAVFWEFGEEYKKEYSVTSLLDFDNIQHRSHHGLTHILRSANSNFYAICLKELIELLNDPEGYQEVQKYRYADEI